MCGIAGSIGTDRAIPVEVLQHRGPDDHGQWSGIVGGKAVNLTHNRLSILDLSKAGHQPMVSADGNFVLVFNGEIYNYKELSSRFFPGQSWMGHGDTEVLLRLLSEQGMEAVNELNGDFAFAFLDIRRAKMWLCRDRFGIKPLYYWQDGGATVFGSEIKALISGGVEALMDESRISAYLAFKFVPGNDTFYKGIHRLPPAHWMEIDLKGGTSSLHKYWELPRGERVSTRFRETAQQLRALIDDAVRLRMTADVPVGTFLSGGLDSSIIASAIRDRKDVVHYVATKKASDLKAEGTTSDRHFAHLLAEKWGLTIEDIPIGSETLNAEMLQKIIYYGDDLIADGSQLPAFLISEGASRRSKVLLSGMGADELFFGYNWHQLAWLDRRMRRLPAFLGRMLAGRFARLQAGRGPFKAYKRYLQKLGRNYQEPACRYGLYALVGDAARAFSLNAAGEEEAMNLIRGHFPRGINVFDALMRFDLAHFLPKNLAYTDRMAMAHSVEVRVPFLDHRVAELAARIPARWKLGTFGRPKHILKEAYRDVVPATIRNRRKAGFGMPLRSIFSERKNIEALLNREILSASGWINMPALDLAIEKHLSGEEDNSALIFAVVMLAQR